MESQFLVVSEASSHHISTLTCFLFVLGDLLMFLVYSNGVGFWFFKKKRVVLSKAGWGVV